VAGIRTVGELRDLIIQLSPEGTLYDWFNTASWLYGLLDGTAQVFYTYCVQMLDTLRAETNPATVVQKISEWFTALGLTGTYVDNKGTTAQKQQAILARLRESGPFTPYTISSVIGPLLGYFPSTPVQVIECSRSMLTRQHSYQVAGATNASIPAGQTTTFTIMVNDGGIVSKMGAQLQLAFASLPPAATIFTITLTAPDGTTVTWTIKSTSVYGSLVTPDLPLVLYAPSLAGAKIQGNWTLAVTNNSGTNNTTLYAASFLFVEGLAPGQTTAGAIFDWGVYVDSAHAGETGTPADLAGARLAIGRLKHAHTVGNLIQSTAPWPDTDGGGAHIAIADECIPS
jgi:hypothetical protein